MSEFKSTMVLLDLIDEDPNQPRTSEAEDSDEPSLEELSESIKSLGVLQPILVVPQENGRYKLVAGHRRTKASKMAGLTEIPAVIREEENPSITLSAQIVENLQRKNLSTADMCSAILKLKNNFNLSINDIASMIGRHRSWVNKIVLVAEETGFTRLAVSEGLFSNLEAAYRFRTLSAPEQENLYKEAKKNGVQLTHTAVTASKKSEFFEDTGGYSGGGSYDPNKYSEPKSSYVHVQEPAPKPEGESEGKGEGSEPVQSKSPEPKPFFPASAVSVKPDPKDFETGQYNRPVVYRDFGTTWVIRISENTLRDLVEKRGRTVKTDEDLAEGVASLFD